MELLKTEKQRRTVLILLILVGMLLVLAITLTQFSWNQKVDSYDACVRQGNPILGSYPSICVSKDGRRFTNPAEHMPQLQR